MRTTIVFLVAYPSLLAAQTAQPGYIQTAPRSRPPVVVQPESDRGAVMSLTPVDGMPAPAVELRDAMPSSVTLVWSPPGGASGFLVYRSDLGQVTPTPLPADRTTFSHSADNDYRMVYQYRVVAVYPDGRYGPSAWIPYQPPKPVNPAAFAAAAHGSTATLTWQAVPGVETYFLGGAGLPLEGVRLPASTTRYEVSHLPLGRHEWMIGSYYPRTVSTPAGEWSRAAATVVETSGPAAGAVSGRYRITLAGFIVHREAPEDLVRADGRRNEAYASAMVRLLDAAGTPRDTATVRTATHGDAQNFPSRVAAGRASETGGLMSGDTVPTGWRPGQVREPGSPGRFPLLLWEGELTNGSDILVIRPQLWEDDEDDMSYSYWKGERFHPWQFASVRNAAAGPSIEVVQGQAISMADAGGWTGKIGALGNGRRERLVVLTRTQIEANLTKSSSSGTPRGLLPIRFVDAGHFGRDDSSGGDYTLYLRVERIP